MVFSRLKYQQIALSVLIPPLLFLPEVRAQTRASKYSLFEQPSVTLGRWVGDLKVRPAMNVVGKNLRGSEFVGQDLTGAVFDGCDLYGVRFVECDLSHASFRRASLSGADIQACGLDGADFRDAVINGLGLASSHLSEQQLKSTHSYKIKDLSNCVISAGGVYYLEEASQRRLVNYDFRSAKLSGARLTNGDFSECDFTDADIGRIALSGARIRARQLGATSNFRQGRLRYMCFWEFQTPRGPCAIHGRVDFSGMDLTGTRFRGRPLDADFSGATISECFFDFTLTKEQLCSTRNYREGNLAGIRLLGIDLSGCDLSRQNLTRCEFISCDFCGADFEDAVITDADFGKKRDGECTGLTLEQIKSTWNYKHGRMDGITLPEYLAKSLQQEQQAKK